MEFHYTDARGGKHGPLTAQEMHDRLSSISPMAKIRAMNEGKKVYEMELFKVVSRNGSSNPFQVPGLQEEPKKEDTKNDTKVKTEQFELRFNLGNMLDSIRKMEQGSSYVPYVFKNPSQQTTNSRVSEESEKEFEKALDLIKRVRDADTAGKSAVAFAKLRLSQAQLTRICDTVLMPALFDHKWRETIAFCFHAGQAEVMRDGHSPFRSALMKDFVSKSMTVMKGKQVARSEMKNFYDLILRMLCFISPDERSATDGLVSLATLCDVLDLIVDDFPRLNRQDGNASTTAYMLLAIVSIIKALAIVPEDGSPRRRAITRFAPAIRTNVLPHLGQAASFAGPLTAMLNDHVTFRNLRGWEDAASLYPYLHPLPTSIDDLMVFIMVGSCSLLQ